VNTALIRSVIFVYFLLALLSLFVIPASVFQTSRYRLGIAFTDPALLGKVYFSLVFCVPFSICISVLKTSVLMTFYYHNYSPYDP